MKNLLTIVSVALLAACAGPQNKPAPASTKSLGEQMLDCREEARSGYLSPQCQRLCEQNAAACPSTGQTGRKSQGPQLPGLNLPAPPQIPLPGGVLR